MSRYFAINEELLRQGSCVVVRTLIGDAWRGCLVCYAEAQVLFHFELPSPDDAHRESAALANCGFLEFSWEEFSNLAPRACGGGGKGTASQPPTLPAP